MQFADLMRLFREGQNEGRKRGYVSQGACDAEGIAAVIRALRDEFGRIMYPGDDWNRQGILEQFDQILGSDAGSEKVAGGQGGNPDVSGTSQMQTPATDPAPDKNWAGALQWEDACRSVASLPDPAPAVCVWTETSIDPMGYAWLNSSCGLVDYHERDVLMQPNQQRYCPSCGKPISFKTEAQR